ncbi:hypothetical protein CJU89_4508 [Yarrowia sp. B02]|nr:hypothetical protein CJU89_4508 [Yarrowia sp. B02]
MPLDRHTRLVFGRQTSSNMRLSTVTLAALSALALAAPSPAPVNAIVNGDKIKNFDKIEKRGLKKIAQEKVIVNGDQLQKHAN